MHAFLIALRAHRSKLYTWHQSRYACSPPNVVRLLIFSEFRTVRVAEPPSAEQRKGADLGTIRATEFCHCTAGFSHDMRVSHVTKRCAAHAGPAVAHKNTTTHSRPFPRGPQPDHLSGWERFTIRTAAASNTNETRSPLVCRAPWRLEEGGGGRSDRKGSRGLGRSGCWWRHGCARPKRIQLD